ncbi:NFYB/HAP3 family transcription factor subunit [Candidatus Pacearchaeota archaeon]|nr:NFYB/HAP3 family transcription factor subunit [Candidatus Pacearchaeota archaeon]
MKTKIQKIIKENKFRITKEALEKIKEENRKNLEHLIKKSIKNAKFSGRRTIQKQDIEEI